MDEMDRWEIWDLELNDRLSKARSSASHYHIDAVMDSLELYYIARYGEQPTVLDKEDLERFTTIIKYIVKYEKKVRSFIIDAFTKGEHIGV